MNASLYILALVLGVMLVVPLVCRRLRLPAIVGYIIVGMIMGQHALGWIPESSTMRVLGQIGMLYILFLSGVELDLNDFRHYRRRASLFGLMSFLLPSAIGLTICHLLLGMGATESLIIAAMLGSHTLITYPIVARYGVQKSRSVNVAVGGSMVAITLALLMLVGIEAPYNRAQDNQELILRIILVIVFLTTVLWGVPRVAQWLLKRRIALTEQFLMVMMLLVVSAALASAAGTDAILGAFLCGLVLNTKIPNRSPLMGHIRLIGDSVFVPVFLLGVGAMIDIHACWSGWLVWGLALMMIVVKSCGKWLAALYTQLSHHWTQDERQLLFGLTCPAAAGTLAIASIGYQLGVMSPALLNATILMILVMCIVSSFVTESAARRIALREESALESDRDEDRWLLIPAAGTSNTALKELATLSSLPDPVYLPGGSWKESIDHVERTWESTIIYHEIQPLSTISRILVAVPRYAEKEHDFISCFGQIRRLSSELGARVTFYCTDESRQALQNFCQRQGKYLRAQYKQMDDFQQILTLQRETQADDLVVLIQARKNTISYDSVFRLLPKMLDRFFTERSYLILYPEQGK